MSRRLVSDEMAAHLQSLRRYALVLVRNRADAEDLVQETLLRALSRAETFRPGADMRVWLFRIMHNAHVSTKRRDQTRDAYAREQIAAGVPAQPASQHDRLEAQAVLHALEKLPEGQREAVALMAVEDLRYSDAAAILDVPLGTFMSRISRGREALRRLLEDGSPNRSIQAEGVG